MRLSFVVVEEYELCKQSFHNLFSLCSLLMSAVYVCDVNVMWCEIVCASIF